MANIFYSQNGMITGMSVCQNVTSQTRSTKGQVIKKGHTRTHMQHKLTSNFI